MNSITINASTNLDDLIHRLETEPNLSIIVEAPRLLDWFCKIASSIRSTLFELEIIVPSSTENRLEVDLGNLKVRWLTISIQPREQLNVSITAIKVGELGIDADSLVNLTLELSLCKVQDLTLRSCDATLTGTCQRFRLLGLLNGSTIVSPTQKIKARSVMIWASSSSSFISSIDHRSVKRLNVITEDKNAAEILQQPLENLDHLSISAFYLMPELFCLNHYPALRSLDLCDVKLHLETLNEILYWNNLSLSMQFCTVEPEMDRQLEISSTTCETILDKSCGTTNDFTLYGPSVSSYG